MQKRIILDNGTFSPSLLNLIVQALPLLNAPPDYDTSLKAREELSGYETKIVVTPELLREYVGHFSPYTLPYAAQERMSSACAQALLKHTDHIEWAEANDVDRRVHTAVKAVMGRLLPLLTEAEIRHVQDIACKIKQATGQPFPDSATDINHQDINDDAVFQALFLVLDRDPKGSILRKTPFKDELDGTNLAHLLNRSGYIRFSDSAESSILAWTDNFIANLEYNEESIIYFVSRDKGAIHNMKSRGEPFESTTINTETDREFVFGLGVYRDLFFPGRFKQIDRVIRRWLEKYSNVGKLDRDMSI